MQDFGVIVCDVRERSSGIPELLRLDSRLRVEERQLESADYIVAGELGVERKTCADFVLSIEDSRLFSQVQKMKARYPRSVMVVEGSDLFSVSRMRKEAIEGALASLAACWQIPVVFAAAQVDTARFLTFAAFQLGRQLAGYYTGDTHGGRRPRRLRTQQLRVFRSFPGIGPVLAQELLGVFGSVRAFANSSLPDLQKVRGIGPRRAAQLLRVLSGAPAAAEPLSRPGLAQ